MGYLDNRGLAYFWTRIKNYTKNYVQNYVDQHVPSSSGITSHVGMIVESTTLDTMQKVIAVYGGTSWIQHSGYFLRGASSGVLANSADADGGEETVTLTAAQSGLPSHVHCANDDTNQLFQLRPNDQTTADTGGNLSGDGYLYPRSKITGWGAPRNTGHNETQDAAEAHNNMPPYKNVYIWERVA